MHKFGTGNQRREKNGGNVAVHYHPVSAICLSALTYPSNPILLIQPNSYAQNMWMVANSSSVKSSTSNYILTILLFCTNPLIILH